MGAAKAEEEPQPKRVCQRQSKNKPPAYQRLQKNQFVGREHRKQDVDDISVCKCVPSPSGDNKAGRKPTQGQAGGGGDVSYDCGPHCINQQLFIECHPEYCPCGERCQNQKFQKREYAPITVKETPGRGWGLFATADIKAGTFVVEYIGEIVSASESQKRLAKYQAEGEAHFYMMNLHRGELIDATRKAYIGRFINHSCEPNCVTKKVEVLGEMRVGIFTAADLAEGQELVYDYDFQWFGGNRVKCLCGTPSCVGYLGAKSRGFQEEEMDRVFGNVTWNLGTDGSYYAVAEMDTYDSTDDEHGEELEGGASQKDGCPELEGEPAKGEPAQDAEDTERIHSSHKAAEDSHEAAEDARPLDEPERTLPLSKTTTAEGTNAVVITSTPPEEGDALPLGAKRTPPHDRPKPPQSKVNESRAPKSKGSGRGSTPAPALLARQKLVKVRSSGTSGGLLASVGVGDGNHNGNKDESVLPMLDGYFLSWAETKSWGQKSTFEEQYRLLVKGMRVNG
eukprot:2076743-Pyramimonas_sp.AAC.1